MFNKKVLLASLVVSTFALSAQARDFTAVDSTSLTQLCMKAVMGNRAAVHNQIKVTGYSKKFIAQNVQCNGENIVSFVRKNGRNSENILKTLGNNGADVSITDLAMNRPVKP
jgi:hypothetical protein